MAAESVADATCPQSEPEYPGMYGAAPVHGNYTDDASLHLWCANALAILVSSPTAAVSLLNEDAQDALRYLLRCEVQRSMNAQKAEAGNG